LCPGNVRANDEVNQKYLSSFVFENDFAALKKEEIEFEVSNEATFFKVKPERGISRVVCFSPKHNITLPEMDLPTIEEIIRTWQREYTDLGNVDYINYVQVFENKDNQKVLSNKGSASMGYGLAGAIGMAFAYPNNRVIHFEGDGGFAQNMQDIGTVSNNKLNIKMFISSNKGYASIRTTQKSYFSGNYLGCDSETGLGLPEWEHIFKAYGIPVIKLNAENLNADNFNEYMETSGPCAFILELDPEQLYFPKLTSKLKDDGSMETNPLHLMSPSLSDNDANKYLKYLPTHLRK
jgi:hypothetical protein